MLSTKTTTVLLSQVLAILVLTGCHAQEEQEILDSIKKGVAALESGDLKDAVKSTSRDFLAYPGKVDRGALIWKLKSIFDSMGGFSVHYPVPDIELSSDGESALVEGPFILSRPGMDALSFEDLVEDSDAWIQEARDHTEVHQTELRMIKSGDRWLVQTLRVF